MKKVYVILLMLFCLINTISASADKDKWRSVDRSTPPISYVEIESDILYIHFELPANNMLLQIWNAEGENIYTLVIVTLSGIYPVSLEEIPAGEYTLRLSDGRGYMEKDIYFE